MFGDAITEPLLAALWDRVPDSLEEVRVDVGTITSAAAGVNLPPKRSATSSTPSPGKAPAPAQGPAAAGSGAATPVIPSPGRVVSAAASVIQKAAGTIVAAVENMSLVPDNPSEDGTGGLSPSLSTTSMMQPTPNLAVLKLLPRVQRLTLMQLWSHVWLQGSGLRAMKGLRAIEIAGQRTAKPDEVLEVLGCQLGETPCASLLWTGYKFADVRGLAALMHIPKLERLRLNGVLITKPECMGALQALAWHRHMREFVLYGASKEEAEVLRKVRDMVAPFKPYLAMVAE